MTDSSDSTATPSRRIIRVPIQRELDEYSPTPAHVRGAQYANLLFDESIGKGDAVDAILLDRVQPSFFERIERERDLNPETDSLYGEFKRDPDIICLADRDDLPDEFEPTMEPAPETEVNDGS
ncbi:hypothetical protein DJ68_14630 [Halorubrum sp. C3]|nr:hypothetical protein DJ68_14630 [Halorubrum sp. C3]